MGHRTKYKTRPDGRKETSKTYNGKKKHFYGATDEEIDAKIAAYEAELAAADAPQVRTFEQVANDWWAQKEDELSPSSVRGYRAHLENSISDFGSLPVNEVTPQLIVSSLRRMALQGYSQKAIKNRRIVIKGILDGALIAGEIVTNPCVGLPVVKGQPPVKRHAASADDISRIEAAADESMYGLMSLFMLYTGCRRGEAAALQQKHINLENKTALICQSVAYHTETPVIKKPKTEAGFRTVDLLDIFIDKLPRYKDPETFIFFPDGLPHKGQLERGLKKFQTEHGIDATAHQLRHSYASMLHSAGVDVKDAQTLLGHSSIIMTQDVYTELEKQHKDKVRQTVNNYVNEQHKSSK